MCHHVKVWAALRRNWRLLRASLRSWRPWELIIPRRSKRLQQLDPEAEKKEFHEKIRQRVLFFCLIIQLSIGILLIVLGAWFESPTTSSILCIEGGIGLLAFMCGVLMLCAKKWKATLILIYTCMCGMLVIHTFGGSMVLIANLDLRCALKQASYKSCDASTLSCVSTNTCDDFQGTGCQATEYTVCSWVSGVTWTGHLNVLLSVLVNLPAIGIALNMRHVELQRDVLEKIEDEKEFTRKEQERKLKLVVLGSTGCGKSSLILRFTQSDYNDKELEHVGARFMSKIITLDGASQSTKYQIWDTKGDPQLRPLASMYYQNAVGALCVYDITDAQSFEDMREWVEELRRSLGAQNVVIAIVGNKADCDEERQVDEQLAREFANSVSAIFEETSAKNNIRVTEVFHSIGRKAQRSGAVHGVTGEHDNSLFGGQLMDGGSALDGGFKLNINGIDFEKDSDSWTVSDVLAWLQEKDVVEEVIDVFELEQIDGKTLITLTAKKVANMVGMEHHNEAVRVSKAIEALKMEEYMSFKLQQSESGV